MKTAIAVIAYTFTLLPVLIPVWIRSGRVAGVAYLDNYKAQFRDLLFLLVVTAALGLLDLVQNSVDGAEHKLVWIDELIFFVHFIFSLIYGLVGVGVCAKYTEAQLEAVNRGIVGFTLCSAGAEMVVAICLKYLVE